MADLTTLGYPQGYHLGFSALLWWIFAIIVAILGIGLYQNARKSELINVKEMLQAKFYVYVNTSIQISLIQIGVFLSNTFLQLYFFGAFLTELSTTFYFYYWEKNLTRIRRIPTVSVGIGTIFAFIGLIISFFIVDLPEILLNSLILSALLLNAISFGMYIYLIYLFSRDVKGGHLTTLGWIWILGTIITLLCLFIEHIGVRFFPRFISFYISPIAYMTGLGMAFYGITRLFTQISSYYSITQKCAVHRGIIEKGKTIHYCPSCGITYCEACFNEVIKKDGCWNCQKVFDSESKKYQIDESIIEQNEVEEPKKYLTKKPV